MTVFDLYFDRVQMIHMLHYTVVDRVVIQSNFGFDNAQVSRTVLVLVRHVLLTPYTLVLCGRRLTIILGAARKAAPVHVKRGRKLCVCS